MAAMIEDEETRIFLLSGMAVFADKIINQKYADEIRRMISMTKVGRLFEAEKESYAAEKTSKIVEKMLRDGVSIEKVAVYADMAIEDVRKIYESLLIKVG